MRLRFRPLSAVLAVCSLASAAACSSAFSTANDHGDAGTDGTASSSGGSSGSGSNGSGGGSGSGSGGGSGGSSGSGSGGSGSGSASGSGGGSGSGSGGGSGSSSGVSADAGNGCTVAPGTYTLTYAAVQGNNTAICTTPVTQTLVIPSDASTPKDCTNTCVGDQMNEDCSKTLEGGVTTGEISTFTLKAGGTGTVSFYSDGADGGVIYNCMYTIAVSKN